MVEIDAVRPTMAVIPPGVGHGFCFPDSGIHVYALDLVWDMSDELGCRWDDPDLGLAWPVGEPLLSERDRTAQPFNALATAVAAQQSEVVQ
jgi:dTDP-4-dehydrorhamnose 3,5-epimerase